MKDRERFAPQGRSKHLRDHEGPEKELIGGRQAVLEALRHGRPFSILMTGGQKGNVIGEITSLAGQKGVPVKRLSRAEFDQTAGELSGNQGLAAYVPPFQYCSLQELIAGARESGEEPFLMMLDHIEDPQNLGAVIRTADAAGLHGLIIPDRRAARVTAAARKVAAGAAERMPVALTGNLNRAAEFLRQEGLWLYGAEADGREPYYRADYRRPLALVIGSEGKGLSPLLRKNCDLILSIPMPGRAGSLNVAVSAAILSYAALAQRKGWVN